MSIATFRSAILFAAILSFGMLISAANADSIVHFAYLSDYGLGVPAGYDVQVYSDPTPITAANFLRYVNNGAYNNSIIHDNYYVNGLGLYGGAYTLGSGTSQQFYPDSAPLYEIPNYGPIENETSLPFETGSIAMATLVGTTGPTSHWVINSLGYPNTSLNDPQYNGAYTVFGRVLPDGMAFVNGLSVYPYPDQIASYQFDVILR